MEGDAPIDRDGVGVGVTEEVNEGDPVVDGVGVGEGDVALRDELELAVTLIEVVALIDAEVVALIDALEEDKDDDVDEVFVETVGEPLDETVALFETDALTDALNDA